MLLLLCQYWKQQQGLQQETRAVGNSREFQIQYDAYHSSAEEGKTADTIRLVEQHVKDLIYPLVKFFSDSEEDYHEPDFVGRSKGKQAIRICERILERMGKSEYSTKQKVLWWIAYRKIIRAKLTKIRSTNVRSLQILFIEGKVDIIS